MEIVPPKNFIAGRNVRAKFTKYDPRIHSFPSPDVIINLTECSNIYPPAILWCAVYLMLWKQRGWSCFPILPTAEDAAASLIDSGLVSFLQKEGIPVYGSNTDIIESADTVLPLTRFDNLREAAELVNRVEETLFRSGLGSANVHPMVCEQFSELVNNAAEHSESTIGAYGFVQFYSSGTSRRFMCGVADGGIGIQRSIERNSLLQHSGYEWSAIELATKEMVSGTGCSNRGIGLFDVYNEMHVHGRELTIHSGKGILTVNQNSEIRVTRANLFPGTLVYFSVPT